MENTKPFNNKKVLVFNTTGDRNAEIMLSELIKCNFDIVLFVPNVAYMKNAAGNVCLEQTSLCECI